MPSTHLLHTWFFISRYSPEAQEKAGRQKKGKPISHWPLLLTVSPSYCHQSYFYTTLRKPSNVLTDAVSMPQSASTYFKLLPFPPHPFDQNKMHINPLFCYCGFSFQMLEIDLLCLNNFSSYFKMTIFMTNQPSIHPKLSSCPLHVTMSCPLSTAPPVRYIETTGGKCYFFSTETGVIILGSLFVPSRC